MRIVLIDDKSQSPDKGTASSFFDAINQAVGAKSARVAFDCEGVALSRAGSLELVSINFDKTKDSVTYLVDVGPKEGDPIKFQERIDVLKKLFECNTVTKIIHDCRMDSDALYHLFGITLRNVHDTSCFHAICTGEENPASLNKALGARGIATNHVRDTNVYKHNPRFWATRPLTKRMKDWAAGDVDKLISLATKQVSILARSQVERACALSNRYAKVLRDMKLERNVFCKIPERQFIGAGGRNIRSVEKQTGTYIRSRSTDKEWLIYYTTAHGLSMAKQAMGYEDA